MLKMLKLSHNLFLYKMIHIQKKRGGRGEKREEMYKNISFPKKIKVH
jgi:hypothetical protein